MSGTKGPLDIRARIKAVAKRLRQESWTVALVPLLTGNKSESFEIRFMARFKPSGDERKRFLFALLQIDWLPRKVRRAVLQELGYSVREYEAVKLGAVQLGINHTKERMREEGQELRGGIVNAAREEVAETRGQTGPTLKKQLQRFRRRQRRKPAPR